MKNFCLSLIVSLGFMNSAQAAYTCTLETPSEDQWSVEVDILNNQAIFNDNGQLYTFPYTGIAFGHRIFTNPDLENELFFPSHFVLSEGGREAKLVFKSGWTEDDGNGGFKEKFDMNMLCALDDK